MTEWEKGIITGASFAVVWIFLITPCLCIVYRDLKRIYRMIEREARRYLRRYARRVWREEEKRRGIAI